MNNKVYIIVGHYGSGKSEFSINFAKMLNKNGLEVALADLDIVNPYFRSREKRQMLTELGIDVISDTLNSTQGLDMPYLSPAVRGQVAVNKKNLILDFGGDDVGIKVMKQFHSDIIKRDFEMYMIINTYRPQTSDVKLILDMKEKLEVESGLKVTGFINNSNFLRHTTVDDLIAASKIIDEVSKITGIPTIYVSGIKNVINQLPSQVSGERLVLDLSLRNNWL